MIGAEHLLPASPLRGRPGRPGRPGPGQAAVRPDAVPGGLAGLVLYHRALGSALGGLGSGLLLGGVYAGALVFVFTRDIGTEIEKIFTNFEGWKAERAKRKAELAAQRGCGADGGAGQVSYAYS